jgi:hypothetical protein
VQAAKMTVRSAFSVNSYDMELDEEEANTNSQKASAQTHLLYQVTM